MVMSTKSFVFTGSGGQGVITASIILGEAAALYEGLNAVQTQVYGPEARGGATRADVVISSLPIRFPKVINPYVLICLTQEAYNKYGRLIRPGGLMIVDPFYVTVSKNVDAYQIALPMYETIKREIGKTMVLNTCMLGCVVVDEGLFPGLVGMPSVGAVVVPVEGVPPRLPDVLPLPPALPAGGAAPPPRP